MQCYFPLAAGYRTVFKFHTPRRKVAKEPAVKTSTRFRISALPLQLFTSFFAMDDRELAEHGASRCVADQKPGYPCRVSLVDAEPGERVILLPFEHHDVCSPYRASGPIFVREEARQADL